MTDEGATNRAMMASNVGRTTLLLDGTVLERIWRSEGREIN